jgi:hypothetical protein
MTEGFNECGDVTSRRAAVLEVLELLVDGRSRPKSINSVLDATLAVPAWQSRKIRSGFATECRCRDSGRLFPSRTHLRQAKTRVEASSSPGERGEDPPSQVRLKRDIPETRPTFRMSSLAQLPSSCGPSPHEKPDGRLRGPLRQSERYSVATHSPGPRTGSLDHARRPGSRPRSPGTCSAGGELKPRPKSGSVTPFPGQASRST